MRKEISKEVYDQLQGVEGLTVEVECKYFLTTTDLQPSKKPPGSRRSPSDLLRVRRAEGGVGDRPDV